MTIKTHLFVLTLLLAATFDAQAQTPQIELLDGKVVSVETGDTITVKSTNQTYSVKLRAIDAPDSGQPSFENSRKSLAKLIDGKDVRVVVQNQDSDGMFIGTVFRDGRDIGLRLVEKGIAWYSKRNAGTQNAAGQKNYSDAQTYASSAGIGLWAEDKPIPPWVFRGENLTPVSKVVEPETNTQPLPTTPMPADDGRKYALGPRGGCYYVAESGRRVYVKDKRRCGVSMSEAKP